METLVNYLISGSSADAEQAEVARKVKRRHGCNKCDFTAEKRSHLDYHEKIEHEGMEDLRSHKCDMCGYSAKRVGQVTEHRRRVHERLKRFKCRDKRVHQSVLFLLVNNQFLLDKNNQFLGNYQLFDSENASN